MTDSSLRILLVDDDRLVLTIMGRELEAAGYAVATAENGAAALELALRQDFDLAVLDIRMPGMSGIEAARVLRETHGLPSLFLTAYGEQELVDRAAAEGGLGYLVKPIDAAKLIPALETAAARARDLRALQAKQEQLAQALDAGRETSVAIGILMERQRLGRDEAFDLLRKHARTERCKIEDYCRDIVAATERLNRH